MKARILVSVSGGLVTGVFSDQPDALDVAVIDYDNWRCILADGPHYERCEDHTPDEIAEYRALDAEANGLKEVY